MSETMLRYFLTQDYCNEIPGGLQIKAFQKLIRLALAWEQDLFRFTTNKQYLELFKVCKIIEREAQRTALDYYNTLQRLIWIVSRKIHAEYEKDDIILCPVCGSRLVYVCDVEEGTTFTEKLYGCKNGHCSTQAIKIRVRKTSSKRNLETL